MVCAISAVLAGEAPRPIVVTPSKEVAWGQKALEAFLQSRRLSDDEALAARLLGIGGRISEVGDRPDLVYSFLVVEGEELQAYTFPGGAMCFTEALVRLFERDDELAFALAHEMAHVALRHHVSQLRFQRALEVDPGLAAGKLAPVRSFYDRSAEMEADSFGALYATRAGYAFSASHESLALLEQSAAPEEDESHPAFDERIEALRGFREELERALRAFDAGVASLQDGEPDVAIGALELFVAAFPNSPAGRINLGAAHLARVRATAGTPENLAEVLPILPDPGVVLRGPLDRVDLERAREAFRHVLRQDPESAWAAAGLALVYEREGRYGEARDLLAGVLEREPGNLDVLLCLGNVEYLAGKPDAAALAYRRVLTARPDSAAAKKNLAQALERTGELSAARDLWRELVGHETFGAEARLRLAASAPTGD